MTKDLAVLSLALLLAGCAIYPEIPDVYLQPRPEPETVSPAPAPSVPQAAEKKLSEATPEDMDQFSEREKEILVSRVYEVLLDQPPIEKNAIDPYPELSRFGNEAVLEVSLGGVEALRKGHGGELLENVTQAARSAPRSELYGSPSSHFKLKIGGLEFLLWGKTLQWAEIIGDRYFLPSQTLSRELISRRWSDNQRFWKVYWKGLNKLLDSAPEGKSPPVVSSLAASYAPSPLPVPVHDSLAILRGRLFSRLSDSDPKLSYVALADGGMDVEGTASLLLLILEDPEQAGAAHPFERIAASLRFIQNEDGSFQGGVQREGLIPKGDLRAPLILKTYHVLYQHGQTAFLEAFKRSFSYYFPANFNAPREAAERLAWGRLLADMAADPGNVSYEHRLKEILNWFFQNILLPGQAARAAVGSFSEKITQDETVSRIEIYEFLAEGYRHFKSRSPGTLPEAWSLGLFFATRSFLNLQIERPDLVMGHFQTDDRGGFSIGSRRLASFQDQLWAARALTEALRFWNEAEWADLREKAEARL